MPITKTATAISVFSHPKVNLALDILGKDKSGYHEIRTVFHKFNAPADEVVVQECDGDLVEVRSDNPSLPLDATNTVYKAITLLKKQSGISKGARVFICKKIPMMSGLGGGASNAVAALKAINKFWRVCRCGDMSPRDVIPRLDRGIYLHKTDCILRAIASQIGMDCAFFFTGGTALGEHFGERITPLPSLPSSIKFEIIPTGVGVSSHWAYQQVDIKKCGQNTEKTKLLIDAIQVGDAQGIIDNLHNDFEEFVFEQYPELLAIKRKTESEKSGHVLLCGSGGALARVYS